MPMQVYKGGVWRLISGAKVLKSGAWRTVVQAQVYAGGAWRTVANFSPPGGGGGGGGTLVVTASPSSSSVSGNNTTLTSVGITATPSGGTAPYTYSWSVVSTDTAASINSPTLATTTVRGSDIVDFGSTTIHCVATDSLGVSGTSNNATITWHHTGINP